MTTDGRDPVITELREQISSTDRAIVELVNKRVDLVARIKRYKESRGMDFLDPDREQRMVADLQRANGGPLSADGVERLLRDILDLVKDELAAAEQPRLRRVQ